MYVFEKFDNQTAIPHNLVHNFFDATMSNLTVAAYDPVFYLHHGNIDRQYAYWQRLQQLRNMSTEAIYKDFPLPPFNSEIYNPFYYSTGINPTQKYGLEYKKHYNYEYDYLLFDGVTPEEFLLQSSERCHNKSYAAIVVKNRFIRSQNDLTILNIFNRTINATITGVFSTLRVKAEGSFTKPFDSDMTSAIINCNHANHLCSLYGLNTNLLHLEIVSQDLDGNSIQSNAFKPTFNFIDYEGKRTTKIHVDYFKEYAPKLELCLLYTAVEFIGSNGNYSDQVKRIVNGEGDTKSVVSPFNIITTKNEFIYKTHKIEVNYDPFCHVKCSEGFPVKRDHCHGDGCVKVVPWRLKSLQDHSNTISSDLIVIVAWCEGQKTDIFEVKTEEDFKNCQNLSEDPVTYSSYGILDGFIVHGPGIKYFVSKSKCENGWKVKIVFT